MSCINRVSTALRAALTAGVLLVPFALPQAVLAQAMPQSELYEGADGRLRGYQQEGIIMAERSTALTYMALGGMTVLAIGVLFKTARRTHLD